MTTENEQAYADREAYLIRSDERTKIYLKKPRDFKWDWYDFMVIATTITTTGSTSETLQLTTAQARRLHTLLGDALDKK